MGRGEEEGEEGGAEMAGGADEEDAVEGHRKVLERGVSVEGG